MNNIGKIGKCKIGIWTKLVKLVNVKLVIELNLPKVMLQGCALTRKLSQGWIAINQIMRIAKYHLFCNIGKSFKPNFIQTKQNGIIHNKFAPWIDPTTTSK